MREKRLEKENFCSRGTKNADPTKNRGPDSRIDRPRLPPLKERGNEILNVFCQRLAAGKELFIGLTKNNINEGKAESG